MHKTIAGYATIGAILLTALSLIFPGILVFGIAALFGASAGALLVLGAIFAVVAVVTFLIYYAILFGIGWLVTKIDRRTAMILFIVLVVVGLIFLQPEIDVIALFGLFFTYALPRNASSKPALPTTK